jgi:acyl-CoA ligase (AMP-forming) (exosortase A-associated)
MFFPITSSDFGTANPRIKRKQATEGIEGMDYLIHHMLRASTERFPEKEAVVDGNTRLSYRALSDAVNSLAANLQSAGIQRGERVGIYLDPSPQQVISIFGVSAADAVYVPINSVLFPEQVSHIVRDCSMSALITSAKKLPELAPLLAELPSLRFLVIDGETDTNTALPAHSFPNWTASQGSKPVERCISKDLAAILYTSGSTGKPKGVMLSHANVMAGATIVSTYLGITDKERILAVLPFSFDAGMNQLTTAIQQGGTIVLIRFSFARDIINLLLKERITGLAGVPTVWTLLTQANSGLQKQPFPDLRYITNTGGAMPQTALSILRQALPTTKVFLMYGLTEAFRSTYLPPEELDRRPTSMGRAIPDTEILVVTEHGQLCKPGEIGELVHRGPTVSMGYWGNQEATDRVLKPNPIADAKLGDSERVCYSGDLVKMDEEGFLFYVGRRDTMIKCSGFRISPTEVEEVLFKAENVKHAAAIGVPDDVMGQAVKAYVVAKPGTTIDTEALIAHCGQHMPRHMVPKYVEVLAELPKTSSGKIDYPALKKAAGV